MTDKPKLRCGFYGCTMPAGVKHHHPLNGPAIIRDPSAPLDDVERAELERYRLRDRDAAYRQAVGMQNSVDTSGWAAMQNAAMQQASEEINRPSFEPHEYIRSEPLPHAGRTFSQQVGTIAVWIVAGAGSLMIVGYAVREAVTALGWAS